MIHLAISRTSTRRRLRVCEQALSRNARPRVAVASERESYSLRCLSHDPNGTLSVHTSRELSDRSFEVMIDDREVSVRDLFPGFDERDRIGLVVSRPHGAVGASLLYLAAVHAFYDLCRQQSDDFWIYPDFYFFHVGRRHGYHGSLDVWPDHKEVLVEAHGDRLLEAVNDRAISWLAVPHGLDIGRPQQREGLASYGRRMRGAFIYSSSGRTPDADVSIRGDHATARYVADVLAPWSRAAQLGPGHVASVIRAHVDEVPQATRDRLADGRQLLLVDGRPCETFRRISPEAALEHFSANRTPRSSASRT